MRVDEAGRGAKGAGATGVMIRRGSKFRRRDMVRVLVATSDHTQRQAMAVALCGAGMETVWAGSGRDAIAEVASGHNGIDAVIVDPGLVDLGIDEVTAVIRAIDRDLAVIVWREPAAAVVNEVVALLEPDLDPSGHS